MKVSKILKSVFVSVLLVFSIIFSSCDNFMQGSLIKEELEKEINYAKSPTYTIRVVAQDKTGSIIVGGGDKDLKVSDHFTVSFQKSIGYRFIKWEAVSKTDSSVYMEEYVTIEPADSLEATVTLIKESNDILIQPLCEESISVVKAFPVDDDAGVCRDSSIELQFSYPLSSDNDLSKIKIELSDSNTNGKLHFKDPEIIDDKLIVLPEITNRITVDPDELKTITIKIPSDFTYVGENGIFEIGEELCHSYRINSSTNDKTFITYGSEDENAGTMKVNGINAPAVSQQYNIGESVTVSYKVNDGYLFEKWDYEDTGVIVVTYPEGDMYDEKGFNSSTQTASATILILNQNKNYTFKAVTKKIPTLNLQIGPIDKAGILKVDGVTATGEEKNYRQGEEITVTFTVDEDYRFEGWATNDSEKQYIKITDSDSNETDGYDSKTGVATIKVKILDGRDEVVTLKPVTPKIPTLNLQIGPIDKAGILKVDGVTATGEEKNYRQGEEITVTFTVDEDYRFEGWATNDSEKQYIKITDSDSNETDGYDSKTGVATIKVKILDGRDEVVTIKPITPKIDEEYIQASSTYGRFNISVEGSYKEGDSQILAFTADSEYQFIRWKIVDTKTNTELDNWSDTNNGYIYIEDIESASTNFTLKKAPAREDGTSTIALKIEPVCIKRPAVVSVSPLYDSDGVYRDRRITIMFDQKLDESTIYYTKAELISDGVWDSNSDSLKNDYELLGTTDKYYGYKDNSGNIVWKSLEICKLSDQTVNLLGCYQEPKFDLDNTGVLRIATQTDVNKMPPLSTDILVKIKKDIGVKAAVTSEKNVTVGLSAVYSWSYFTNTKYDNDPPTFSNVQMAILKGEVGDLQFTNNVLDQTKDNSRTKFCKLENSNILKDNIPAYNVYKYPGAKKTNTKGDYYKLWIGGSVIDPGSGPSALTVKIYRIKNDLYSFNKAVVSGSDISVDSDLPNGGVNLAYTATMSVTGSVGELSYYNDSGILQSGKGAVIDLVSDDESNSLKEEGVYVVQLVATDKNDLSAIYDKYFYFVFDDEPPAAIDKNSIVENRSINSASHKWTKIEETDFDKVVVETRKSNDSETPINTETVLDRVQSTGVTGLTDQQQYTYTFRNYDVCGNYSETTFTDDVGPSSDGVEMALKWHSGTKEALRIYNTKNTADLLYYTIETIGVTDSSKHFTSEKLSVISNSTEFKNNFLRDSESLNSTEKYKYKVVFYDYSGNPSKPVELYDTTPPAKITNVYYGRRDKKIIIGLKTPEDSDFKNIKISGTNVESYNLNINSTCEIVMNNVSNDSDYTYKITTMDYCGNESEESVSITVNNGLKVGNICYYTPKNTFICSDKYQAEAGTPIGVIWKVELDGIYSDENNKTEANYTGNVRITDLKRDEARSLINAESWSGPGNDKTIYTSNGRAYYDDVISRPLPEGQSAIIDYLRGTKNVNSPVTWYLPGVSEVNTSTGIFNGTIKAALKAGYSELNDNGIETLDIYEGMEFICCPVFWDNGLCANSVYSSGGSGIWNYSWRYPRGYGNFPCKSIYMAHVDLR